MNTRLIPSTAALLVLAGVAFAQDKPKPDFEKSWGGRVLVHRLSDATRKAIADAAAKENGEVKLILGERCTQDTFEKIAAIAGIVEIEIDHGNEHVDSFVPVAKMTGLRKFTCRSATKSKNNPFDLAPFAKLKQLEHVDFYATHVKNTDALAGHEKLTHVSFYMSNVSSIDFLTTTPNVKELTLYGFGHTFKDYTPVLSLKKLTYIDIYMNKQATDELLAPLAAITTIQKIRMSNSRQITNLGFLAGSDGLLDLNAAWATKLTDASAIADCKKIYDIDLRDSQIASADMFAGFPELSRLDISGTKITDLTPLAECPKLARLKVAKTKITDMTPLAKCTMLSNLDISSTAVTDLTPLTGLTHLTSLTVSKAVPQDQIDKLKATRPKLNVRVK